MTGRRTVLGGILAFPASIMPASASLPLLAHPEPPAADPVHAAIARHAAAWASLGPMPDDEDGADFEAWGARSALTWSTWRDLMNVRPTTHAGCIALARYIAGHPLSANVDGDDSLPRALRSIADALSAQETL